MKIVINTPPRTKKNHSTLTTRNGTPLLLPSKAFRDFQRNCLMYLAQYRHLNIDYPINLKCHFYLDKNAKSDLVGYLQAIQDVLVHYHVLEDDNRNIIVSTDGSRVYLDRENPRIEIEIDEVQNE